MRLQQVCVSLFIKAADGPGLMRHSSGIIEASHKEGSAHSPRFYQLQTDLITGNYTLICQEEVVVGVVGGV